MMPTETDIESLPGTEPHDMHFRPAGLPTFPASDQKGSLCSSAEIDAWFDAVAGYIGGDVRRVDVRRWAATALHSYMEMNEGTLVFPIDVRQRWQRKKVTAPAAVRPELACGSGNLIPFRHEP